MHVPDADAWWHLRAGRWMLERGGLPETDPFSSTASDRQWVAHEWPIEVAAATIERALGLDALLLVKVVLVAGTLLGVWAALGASLRERPLLRLAVGAAVLAGIVPALSPRPWLVSFLLLAILMWIWERPMGARRRRILGLAVLLAAWVNLHGLFVVGFLWLLLQGRIRTSIPSMALGSAGALVHPLGPGVLLYPWSYPALGLHRNILEWLPPDTSSAYGRLLLLAVTATVLLFARAGASGTDWATAVGLGALAFTSQRHIPIFFLGLAPAWGRALGTLTSPWSADRAAARARSVYVVVVVAALAGRTLSPAPSMSGDLFRTASFDRLYPKAAVEWLVRQPGSATWRVFNFYSWGGYMLYAGHPPLRTFIDGRTDLFGPELAADYQAVASLAPSALHVLDRHRVDTVLFPVRHPLVELLSVDGCWEKIYADGIAAILRKRR